MPLPALIPLAAKAAPWIASTIGTMLPAIVDSFRSGKSPEEAAKIVAPKRQEIVDRLIGTGMNQAAAEAMADESIKGELANAQLPEPMNPWLTAGLAIAGGVGGYKAGKMIGAKIAQPITSAPPASAPSSADVQLSSKPDVYTPGFRSPAIDKAMAGSLDSVTASGPFPSGRNIGYQSEPSMARLMPPSQRVGYVPQLGAPFPRDTVIQAGYDPSKAIEAEYRMNTGVNADREGILRRLLSGNGG